jgi:hypothetical protein
LREPEECEKVYPASCWHCTVFYVADLRGVGGKGEGLKRRREEEKENGLRIKRKREGKTVKKIKRKVEDKSLKLIQLNDKDGQESLKVFIQSARDLFSLKYASDPFNQSLMLSRNSILSIALVYLHRSSWFMRLELSRAFNDDCEVKPKCNCCSQSDECLWKWKIGNQQSMNLELIKRLGRKTRFETK